MTTIGETTTQTRKHTRTKKYKDPSFSVKRLLVQTLLSEHLLSLAGHRKVVLPAPPDALASTPSTFRIPPRSKDIL